MAQLFTKPKKPLMKPGAGPPSLDIGVSPDVIKLSSRIRISEERYGVLRKKLQLIEQNFLSFQKKTVKGIKDVDSDINDLKRMLHAVESKVVLLIKELQLLAKKEDVDVIRKYVDYWTPIKFVTVAQVEKMIKEELGKE